MLAERDRLREGLATVIAERDELKGHLERLNAEIAESVAARSALLDERDRLQEHLDHQTQLAADAEAARDAITAERDTLQHHLDHQTQLAADAEGARAAMEAERDDLQQHLLRQSELAREAEAAREAITAERDTLQRHLDHQTQLAADAEAAREAVAAERDVLKQHVDELKAVVAAAGRFLPGHFYSPIPSLDEIDADADRIWHPRGSKPVSMLPGLDLREADQLALLEELTDFLRAARFDEGPGQDRRYHLDNRAFRRTDASLLQALLRAHRPARVIEVGSGFSSAVMLDTADEFLDGGTEFTFIEPYPDQLHRLLRPGDLDRVELLQSRVQDVPLDVFERLDAGDWLFIDSTHVSKVGSDLNTLVFDVVPRVAPGVVVHFHDIPYPFEYPRQWVYDGRFWNEAYLLRALLMHSTAFEILIFSSFLHQCHREALEAVFDGAGSELDPGGSLYLRRTG